MHDFKNKVALVTGATSGIGSDTALAFAKAGAKVVFTGRREDRGRALADKIRSAGAQCAFVQGDISDENHVKKAVQTCIDQFGGLHLAFNNAGVEGELAPTHEQTTENYRSVFDTNVLGVLLSMKHEVPAMLKSGGGAIVNTSSIAGLIGMPGGDVYSASKHAVNGLTKCAALAYASQGVRINAVCPAAIETDMYTRFTGGDKQTQTAFTAQHPIGRIGKASEISDAVLWLCSPQSSFVTGQCVPVDGGFTSQ